MRKSFWTSYVAAALLLSGFGCGKNEQPAAESILGFLPVGSLSVDVMGPSTPPELAALYEKFQEAGRKDPDWFLARIKTAPEGQPLPYHPKLGLTEQEYARFLELQSSIAIITIFEATLRVEAQSPSRYRLGASGPIAALDGIAIDVDAHSILTPFGTLTESKAITANPRQTATGHWNGTQWSLTEGDPNGPLEHLTAKKLEFALGRLEDREAGILHYSVRVFENGQQLQGHTVLLTYELP